MADEIKLKAPTVEQQVVVNISGEDKLEKFADTLDKISKGRGLQKYWKDQQTLINDTIKAYNNFNKSTSQTDATELIKTTNALKAMVGVDISTLIPDFDKFASALSKAEGIAGHLTDAFTEKAFRDAFSSFETLKAYGLDLENFFKHFEFNADVDKLVSELNNANDAVSNLKSKVTQLEDKLEESESGNGIRAVREECENLRWEIERIRDEAAETFSAFLTSNNINAGSYQYEEFFERIREGSLTAQEAIAEFKRDYSYLLEGGASFDTTQLQDFSRRLDDVLKRITDVSEKIDYISSNGVKVSDFGGSGSGNFEELANVVSQIENTNINGSASAIYESLSKILTAIKEIGQCDTDNIYHIYATIRNLAQLNDLKINKASLDNLADCLERICNIGNSSTLTNLSMLDLKKFNELHISKASLNNLAEYLPQIANVDVRTLVELANIDFDKLNSLHIDKDSMKNLFSFVEGLRNATGLTDFTTENKNIESSADASTGSLKTEAELMQSIATNAEKAAKAKKEFVEANKELAKATETSATALSKENSELGEMSNKSTMKDTFQGDVKASAESSAPAVKEEAKAMKQVAENAEKASKAKNEFAYANERVNKGVKKSSESISEEASEFNKIINKLDGYNTKLANFTVKPADGNRYPIYQKNIDELTEKINKLQVLSEKDINLINTNDVEDAKTLQKQIDELIFKMSKMSASEKGFDPLGADKALEKINSELKKNPAMSKEAKRQIQAFYDEIRSGNPSRPIKDILDEMYKLIQLEREAGREGKRFIDILSDKALYGQAAQLAGYYLSLTDFIRYGKQMVDTVIEIDTALTELRKVSDATEQRLTENFKNSAKTAKDLGATVSDVISATADWARMGYNVDDAEELARISTLYKNVGDGIEIEEANNSLISTLQGFQLTADDAESVIDKFNEVANNFAIDSAGIGEALQRSAASFNAANTDLSKSIALITATNEVVQNPEVVGTLWKTMSARIRGAKTELEELGEETDEYTETTSKLRDLVKGLTGFDIMADEDTFKDIYEIILGIGQEWENLTDVEQASLGEALAGKRSANALYAVLGNLDTLEDVYKTAEKSAGSAMREQENYEKSIQYSLERLTASAQEWSAALVDSGVIKWFVDLANAIVEVSTAITPLGTLALGGGLFAGIKNVGMGMLVAY